MLAWHYTIKKYLPSIITVGEIMPAASYVVPPEKPIVWFSLNQYWENTANKHWTDANGLRILTMRETFEMGGGLVRFGCEVRQLHLGEALRRKASMSNQIWRALCNEGRKQKASPSDWCGSIVPVPVSSLVMEFMNDSFQWERIEAVTAA